MKKPKPAKQTGAEPEPPHPSQASAPEITLQPRPHLRLGSAGDVVATAAHPGNVEGPLASVPVENIWRGRVTVFIDGLSLFYGARSLNIELDYIQLLRYLAREGRLLHAFFYAGVDGALETSRQQGFLTWMRHHGYRVVTKAVQHFPDGNKKLDIDVEIAVDMMKLSAHCDTMVLVSGNDTLSYALRRVSDRGVRVELLGLGNPTSHSLLNLVDGYSDLADIQAQVRLQPAAR